MSEPTNEDLYEQTEDAWGTESPEARLIRRLERRITRLEIALGRLEGGQP